MNRSFATIVLCALLCSCSLPVFAHEYWLEPDKFFLLPREATKIHLFVGDGLTKDREERPFQRDKTVLFRAFSHSHMMDLGSFTANESMPIYEYSSSNPGNHLLAMERNWSYITLEPDKFDDYLREDGMEYILAEREKLKETSKPGRERYARFIKTLLQIGEKRTNIWRKDLGMKLELIPLANPYDKKVGETIGFRVLFDGKPLVGRTVFADNRDSETQRAVTDQVGEFSFVLKKNGLWLVRLVVMQRCKAECGGADWESFWGAFSFGVQ